MTPSLRRLLADAARECAQHIAAQRRLRREAAKAWREMIAAFATRAVSR